MHETTGIRDVYRYTLYRKYQYFSNDKITEIVEARISISYLSTFRTPYSAKKEKILMLLTKKDHPFHSKMTLEFYFAPDKNLARLCTYQNEAWVDQSSTLKLVCLDILNNAYRVSKQCIDDTYRIDF